MNYKYDLAISFAGEQRGLADTFARRLDASGYSIFYDEFQQAELWGRDLSVALSNVYSREARYCLIVLSKDYVAKPWTNHERQSAISQFIQRRSDYIFCLKVEDIELPGFPSIIGYISLDRFDGDAVYKLLLQKLGRPDHENQVSHLDPGDSAIAQQVIEACFRRAIYTRMDSEIDMRSMYNSIGKALGAVQQLTPRIRDQALQLACGEIISALDDIERAQTRSDAGVSNHLPQPVRQQIDLSKQKVVRRFWRSVALPRFRCSYPSRSRPTIFGDQSKPMKNRERTWPNHARCSELLRASQPMLPPPVPPPPFRMGCGALRSR